MRKKASEIQLKDSHPIWQQGLPFNARIAMRRTIKFEHNGESYLVQYSMLDKIGEGNYGKVYKAKRYKIDYQQKRLIEQAQPVVIKVVAINGPGINENEITASLLRESELGQQTPHLAMMPAVISKGKGFLVMNYLEGDELEQKINGIKPLRLSTYQKMQLSLGLLQALQKQVIDAGLVHRDLKPENILVTFGDEIQVNITDYGLAKNQGGSNERVSASPFYMALELYKYKRQVHDTPCDIYAIGRILAQIWDKNYTSKSNRHPFCRDAAKQAANDFCLKKLPLIELVIKQMLDKNPNERPEINELIDAFAHFVNNPFILKAYRLSTQLRRYATKLSETDAAIVKNIAIKLDKHILSDKGEQQIARDCLTLVNNQELIDISHKHQRLRHTLKNVGLAIVGLVVFYLLATLINYFVTGRATFFHNEISNIRYKFKQNIAKTLLSQHAQNGRTIFSADTTTKPGQPASDHCWVKGELSASLPGAKAC